MIRWLRRLFEARDYGPPWWAKSAKFPGRPASTTPIEQLMLGPGAVSGTPRTRPDGSPNPYYTAHHQGSASQEDE